MTNVELPININDEMYFVDLDSHKDSNNVLHTECKISKVKINWIYTFKDEATKYLFEVESTWRHWTYEQLFRTKEEAVEEAKEIIKAIPIFIENELYIEN